VLKKVSTALNSVGVDPGGRTLPTVIVDACATVATSSAPILATTAMKPNRPNIPCLIILPPWIVAPAWGHFGVSKPTGLEMLRRGSPLRSVR
jgi:hypothetical protein